MVVLAQKGNKMSNFLLISFIICLLVVFIMVKQINKITSNIDAKQIQTKPPIYADFAAFIQNHIREIKNDIDHTKDTPYPKYKLQDTSQEEKALEFLADTIRQLVFFETPNSKRNNPKETEGKLFGVLSSLDDFFHKYIQNGENIADELREKFAKEFSRLKN